MSTGGGAGRDEPNYDLEERTARFGEAIIAFAKRVPQNCITLPLISQLVRAGTSVGANYCEADDAVSKKEFRCKIGTCKKEARESKHWLRMIVAAEESQKADARPLWSALARGQRTPPNLCGHLSKITMNDREWPMNNE